jgi:hypothetical protein
MRLLREGRARLPDAANEHISAWPCQKRPEKGPAGARRSESHSLHSCAAPACRPSPRNATGISAQNYRALRCNWRNWLRFSAPLWWVPCVAREQLRVGHVRDTRTIMAAKPAERGGGWRWLPRAPLPAVRARRVPKHCARVVPDCGVRVGGAVPRAGAHAGAERSHSSCPWRRVHVAVWWRG